MSWEAHKTDTHTYTQTRMHVPGNGVCVWWCLKTKRDVARSTELLSFASLTILLDYELLSFSMFILSSCFPDTRLYYFFQQRHSIFTESHIQNTYSYNSVNKQQQMTLLFSGSTHLLPCPSSQSRCTALCQAARAMLLEEEHTLCRDSCLLSH